MLNASPLDARGLGMTAADKQFVKELGRRVAQLRQEAGLSQQVVADHLGIAQQTLAHYEGGRLRLPVVLVPKLAQLFGVPTDALLGVPGARAGKRGPAPKLQHQLERLQRLPKAKQKLILELLDGMLLSHR